MAEPTRRLARGLAGTAFLFMSMFAFLLAEVVAVMTCDDTCSPDPGREWSRYRDSLEWDVIGWLGWAMLLSAVACAVATRLGHRAIAGPMLGVWVLSSLGLASLLTSGDGVWFLPGAVAGAAMVFSGQRVRTA
ncbi:MAG: hypothetical protein QOD73_1445 [Solirubrobacteraceae bacterium]|jgi:hypothetical protein|nr:hypothetical protein [Solirubrobacteraceae bacterium]